MAADLRVVVERGGGPGDLVGGLLECFPSLPSEELRQSGTQFADRRRDAVEKLAPLEGAASRPVPLRLASLLHDLLDALGAGLHDAADGACVRWVEHRQLAPATEPLVPGRPIERSAQQVELVGRSPSRTVA